MATVIMVRETGGPDVLVAEDVTVNAPLEGEVLIQQSAIGLNFIDVYFRTGLYPAAGGLPFVPGNEAAGRVLSVGPGVNNVQSGDRVAYFGPMGAYASKRCVPADRLIKLPDTIDDKTAAAMMLKGLTAQYLLRQTFDVQAGQTILFHAAAGGVGLIACQWANYLGATVIGTVGSDEKAELARANGCHHVINYGRESFVERVAELTDGRGCDVVYDSIGKDTYPGSLDCLKPRGYWVSFGQASGPIEDFNLGLLAQKGSLYATRPTLFTYAGKSDDYQAMANDVMNVLQTGTVKIDVRQEYPLAQAAEAHRALEARQTTGASVLIP